MNAIKRIALASAITLAMIGFGAAGNCRAATKIDLKTDCGAVGDGKTNDTLAFEKANKLLQDAGGGTLNIPKATYIVGLETHVDGKTPYYTPSAIIELRKLNGLTIEGNGATIKMADGLHYGAYDPTKGQPLTLKNNTNYATACKLANVIDMRECSHAVIKDLTIDGNLANLNVGGPWGDTGWQIQGSGIVLYNDTDVKLTKINSHHNALDGSVVGWIGLKADGPETPCAFTDCAFEYNGRQGLSWVGGKGLKAIRCKFNHTARALLANGKGFGSMPAGGLDIEAEDGVDRDGLFQKCEFVDNYGPGMVAESGDGGYSKFEDCEFWGVTNWSAWLHKPGLHFEGCDFFGSVIHGYGSPDPALATQFVRCNFEDKPYTDGKVYRQNSDKYLVEIDGPDVENILFDSCTFTANTCRSIWFQGGLGSNIGEFDNCTITHLKADLPGNNFMAVIRGAVISGCHFAENIAGSGPWYLELQNITLRDSPPTTIDGPTVHWLSPKGPTGLIKNK